MELLEIEKELAGPEGERAMLGYDAQLVALSDRLDAALREGLPPEEYPRAEQLRDAIVVARKLLRLQRRGRTGKKSLFTPTQERPWNL